MTDELQQLIDLHDWTDNSEYQNFILAYVQTQMDDEQYDEFIRRSKTIP